MRFKVYANLIGLMLLVTASVLKAEAPPSPAKLNITPVYQDLLLPDSYVPKEFRIDSPSVAFNPSNPPRKSGYSQFFLIEVPHPSMGGKISVSSNADDWIRVSISQMRVYPLAQDAKSYFAYITYSSSFSRKVDLGDEALFRPWREEPWKPNRNMLDKTTHQWDYRSTDGVVRIGRVIFYIGVRGNLEIDRVDADTGKGFVSYQGSITLKECPTREELDGKMRQFVDGIRSYADAMGWMKDEDVKKKQPSAAVSTSKKTSDAKPGAGDSSPTGDGRSIPEFTPAQLAAASSLAGGAALVGALLLMGVSGVGREDVVQAIRDLLRGSIPADSFDAWKQKYEALGWKYNVTKGVATFDPVDGCRNEEGLIWSSQKGAFVRPDTPVAAASVNAIPKDGDVNERGEVWSSLSGGYVDRKTFDQDLTAAKHIKDVNAGINTQSDAVAQNLGHAWADSRQKLEDARETGKYVDLCGRLADHFGTTEEKTWCLDFINRHAKAGPDGYGIDPETARQMYSGLKKQMYTSGQILNLAETQYQTSVSNELEKKTRVAAQIRDNAARVNRVLAKFDPTGTGGKIIDFQQSVYGAIDGYEKGGLAGAAESAMLTVADNYTQGYASGNYTALKEAYAEHGISDDSLASRLARANFDTANNKYNVLDHVGKAANNILEGEYGAAFDSTIDAFDAKDSLKDDYGKAKEWATGQKVAAPDKMSVPPADTVPDTTSAGEKSLGTMRRESFDKTRVSFENQTKMMQELNRAADIPDPDRRQAELIRIRNSDPSAYNVVKKELHPETARVITETNKNLSDKIVERQAQILSEKGFTPEVRLTGKAGGADTDGQWTLTNSDGNVLPDQETKTQAQAALKQASDEILEPLGTNADEMGHKIMNDSREKFDADPDALGIESRDGRLVGGKLVTEGHAKTGDHWKETAARRAAAAPQDRISSEAMTKTNAASLGEVMKTKTEHLDEIARSKGGVTESNMRDMAREITKTDQRTFLAMADKAGVKPTPEYRDLMQKLKLVSDGDISSDHLPPVREIDRIIAENVGMLKDALKE
ncbi:MAG: hypothetical protein EG826_03680 [Deltaproteobacteria bacterium]|nr:hypothetical protein [Deltaproteobacteria bacterium]